MPLIGILLSLTIIQRSVYNLTILVNSMGKLDTIFKKVIKTRSVISSNEKDLTESDIQEIVRDCREEIQKSVDTGIMPSPKTFEQIAILSRKERHYENEIAICEMYIGIAKQYAVEKNYTREQISQQLMPICAPLYKRMHNAKTMLSRLPSGAEHELEE